MEYKIKLFHLIYTFIIESIIHIMINNSLFKHFFLDSQKNELFTLFYDL